jgi:starch-binding outer membrane protein, SusD/RagB family
MLITTYHKRFLIIAAIGCMITVFSSCKKYLEIDLPKDKLTSETVFSSATNALAAVNGLYTFALQPRSFITYQGDFLMGLSADEFIYGSNQYDEFTNNSWLATNADVAATWKLFYAVIYQANGIIEKMPGSPVSDSAKAVYIAEAKVFRAFCHLYLTSYWGDVPLIQTTDVTVTASLGRTSKADVLNAIITDLTEAEAALPTATVRNGRFNKYMATALLARVNLYQKNWSAAEAKATSLIGNTSNFTLLTDLTKVFLRGSKEAIWQVNTADNNYTYWASFNVPVATTTSTKSLNMVRPELYNAFEVGDKRKTSWLGSTTIAGSFFYYDFKYKQLAAPTSTANIEDYMLLRLAEQYLIRAEARAQQDNLTGAIDDLNVIRNRAGLTPLLVALGKSDVLLAVEKERKLELFGEGYGHRWIDLARTGRIDAVLGAEKPSTWKSGAAWLPVPQNEIINNPALNP